MIAEVIGLGSALKFLQKIGMQAIGEYEDKLLDALYKELETIPHLHILGSKQNRKSLITFTVDGVHPLDLATLLDLQGFAIRSGHMCAQPVMRHYGLSHASRASVAFYNTLDEIYQFADTLKKIITQLR